MIAIGASRSKDLLIVGFTLLGVAFSIPVCYFGVSKYMSLQENTERPPEQERQQEHREPVVVAIEVDELECVVGIPIYPN